MTGWAARVTAIIAWLLCEWGVPESMATLEYPPGEEILRPFSVRPNTLVLTPGPSNSYPRVLDVSSHQVTTEDSDGIFRTMDELIVGIQYVFQTSNSYTYAVGGTGEVCDLPV